CRGQEVRRSGAGAGATGGTKDQSSEYLAPCLIQSPNSLSCVAVSFMPDSAGGIKSSVPAALIRRHASLFVKSPGTTGACPSCSAYAPSFVSNRSFALRLLASG